MTRYVPDGDEPYVLRQRWWQLLAGLLSWLPLLAAIGWLGIAMQLYLLPVMAALGCLLALTEGVHQVGAGDRSGIEFAIEERGIYFGDRPYELIPWPQVSTVYLVWARHDPDETGSGQSTWYEAQVRIVIAAPTDLPTELPTSNAPSRVRHAVSIEPRWDLKWEAIERAVSQHAPPHVEVVRYREP